MWKKSSADGQLTVAHLLVVADPRHNVQGYSEHSTIARHYSELNNAQHNIRTLCVTTCLQPASKGLIKRPAISTIGGHAHNSLAAVQISIIFVYCNR